MIFDAFSIQPTGVLQAPQGKCTIDVTCRLAQGQSVDVIGFLAEGIPVGVSHDQAAIHKGRVRVELDLGRLGDGPCLVVAKAYLKTDIHRAIFESDPVPVVVTGVGPGAPDRQEIRLGQLRIGGTDPRHPEISCTIEDEMGVALRDRPWSVTAEVDGHPSQGVTVSGADIRFDPEALTEGRREIVLTVASTAGPKLGARFAIPVLVDVRAPIVQIDQAALFTSSATPAIEVRARDLGSGVDESSLVLTIDGAAVAAVVERIDMPLANLPPPGGGGGPAPVPNTYVPARGTLADLRALVAALAMSPEARKRLVAALDAAQRAQELGFQDSFRARMARLTFTLAHLSVAGASDPARLAPDDVDRLISATTNTLLSGAVLTGPSSLSELIGAVNALGASRPPAGVLAALNAANDALARGQRALARIRVAMCIPQLLELAPEPDRLLIGATAVVVGIAVEGTGAPGLAVPAVLRSRIDAIQTAPATIQKLRALVAAIDAALAAGDCGAARKRLADLVDEIVARGNLPPGNRERIVAEDARLVIDAAIDFLARLPAVGLVVYTGPLRSDVGSIEELMFVTDTVAVTSDVKGELLKLLQRAKNDKDGPARGLATFVGELVKLSQLAPGDTASALAVEDARALLTGTANILLGQIPWMVFRIRPASALAEAIYHWGISVADRRGNRSAPLDRVVCVDATPPRVVATLPASGITVGPAPVIELRCAPELSGLAAVSATLDGVGVTTRIEPDGQGIQIAPGAPFSDGAHRVAYALVDRAGNRTTGELPFAVDAQGPAIREPRPVPDSAIGGETVIVSAQLSDARSGIDAATIRVVVDGQDVTAQAVIGASSAMYVWPSPAEGRHTVRIECADRVGNSTRLDYAFSVDRTPAVVTLDPALDLRAVTDSTIDVRGTLSEPASVTVAGVPAAVAADLSFHAEVPLAAGANHLVATAVDPVGNTSVSPPVEVYCVTAGVAAVTGVVLTPEGAPAPGVLVVERKRQITGVTNALGRFLLTGVPATDLVLDLDPRNAGLAGCAPCRLRIRPRYGSVISPETPIYLLRSALADGQEVPLDGGVTTAQAANQPGMSIRVANAAAVFPDGAARRIAIHAVPAERLPVDVPSYVPAGPVAVLEPSGLTLPSDQRARITLPNAAGHEPAAIVPLIVFNGATASWELGGFGKVSADAATIESLDGMGLRHFSFVAAAPLGPRIETVQQDSQGPGADALNGALELAVELPSFVSQDTRHTPTLVYSSMTAAPSLVVTGVFKGMKELTSQPEIVVDSVPLELSGHQLDATAQVTRWQRGFWPWEPALVRDGTETVDLGDTAHVYLPDGADSPFDQIPSGYWDRGSWIEVTTSVVSRPLTFFKATLRTTTRTQSGVWPESITSRYLFADLETRDFTLYGPLEKKGPPPALGQADTRSEFPTLPANLALTYHMDPRLPDGSTYPTGLYQFLARYSVAGRGYQVVQRARVAESVFVDRGWHEWMIQLSAESGGPDVVASLLNRVSEIEQLYQSGGELSTQYAYSDPLDYLFHTDAGRLVIHNLSTSPFGRGWWFKEVQELHPLGHSRVLVTGPDGKHVFTTRQTIQTIAGGRPGAIAALADGTTVAGAVLGDDGRSTGEIRAGSDAWTLPDVIRHDSFLLWTRSWQTFPIFRPFCTEVSWDECEPWDIFHAFCEHHSRRDCHDEQVGTAAGWSEYVPDPTPPPPVTHVVRPEIAGLAIALDGSVYAADRASHRVFMARPGEPPVVIAGKTRAVSGSSTSVTGTTEAESRLQDTWSGEEIDPAYTPDGVPLADARLHTPSGLAFDLEGDLLVAEAGTHRIRRLDLARGVLETFAGSGSGDYTAATAPARDVGLPSPMALAAGPTGDVFVLLDLDGIHQAVGCIDAAGYYHHVVGNPAGTVNLGVDARLYKLVGSTAIAVDPTGRLLISVTEQNVVLAVTGGFVDVVAGTGEAIAVTGDGGLALAASLIGPRGVAVTPEGNVLVSDPGHGAIRQLDFAIGTMGSTELEGPPGYYESRLRREADGTWSRCYKDGSVATFDAAGRHLATTDRNGHATRYEYGERGRLIGATYPMGASLAFRYAPDGRLREIEDHAGRVTRFETRGADLAAITLADGGRHAFDHDAAGRIVSRTDVLGVTSTFAYNDYGRLLSESRAGQQISIHRPDDAVPGNQAVDAPRQATSPYTELRGDGETSASSRLLVENGVPTELIGQGDESLRVTYGANRLPATIVRPNRQPVSMQYNTAGDTLEVRDLALGTVERFDYDGGSRRTAHTDGSGVVTRWTYDPAGNVLEERRGPRTIAESSLYGPAGELQRRTSHGVETRYAYDERGNMIREAAGEMAVSYERDAVGNITSRTVGHRRTEYRHDVMDRLTDVIDARGQTGYRYDLAGRLTRMLDTAGGTETYAYDERGKQIERVDPVGARWTAEYDEHGNQLSETAPDGTSVRTEYADHGRSIRRSAPGTVVTEARHGDGSLRWNRNELVEVVNQLDGAGRQVGQEIRIRGQAPIAIAFDLDGAGRKLAIRTPGETIHFAYDDAGALRQIRCGALGVELDRDDGGRIVHLTRLNGVVTDIAYDDAGHTRSIAERGANPGLLARTLELNAEGDCVAVRDQRGAWSFVHDAAGQLTHAARDGASPVDLAYQYDARGNRIAGPEGAYRYDDTSWLLLEAPLWHHVHDGRGNLIEKICKAAPSVRQRFEYSPFGHLVGFREDDGGPTPRVTARYWFDGLGRRIGKEVAYRDEPGRNQTRWWVHDGDELLLELDAQLAVVRQYIPSGTPDGLVGFIEGERVYYYAKDHLGGVEQVLDATGEIVSSYTYDPFGQLLAIDEQVANRCRFTGREWDEESATYHFRRRQYDPRTGRFLQQDPDPGHPLEPISMCNRYVYVRNSPLTLIDTTGRSLLTVFRGLVGAIVSFAVFVVAITIVDVILFGLPGLVYALANVIGAAILLLSIRFRLYQIAKIGQFIRWIFSRCRTGRIQHVFVLMLENRSFDHMLGYSEIKGTDAETGSETAIDGLTGDEHCFLGGTKYTVSSDAPLTLCHDPPHEFDDVRMQLCGGGSYPDINNSGFVQSYAQPKVKAKANEFGNVMKSFTENQLPFLTQLAREFAVCDAWFSSMPGPTWPNRFFVHAASSGGLDDSPDMNNVWETIKEVMYDGAIGYGFDGGTIYDQLDRKGLDWRIYEGDDTPQSFVLSGMNWDDLMGNFQPFDDFVDDLQDDYRCQYTFIEPNYGNLSDFKGGNSQHPIGNVTDGEQLIKIVYEAIRNSPVWENSLLVILYDEHGGFYDHVAPGPAPAPGDSRPYSKKGFDFTLLGVRVPAVVISPFIPRGTIDHRLYDHSSIPKTLESLFGLDAMTERDRWAQDLGALLSLPEPRSDCPVSLSSPLQASRRVAADTGCGDADSGETSSPLQASRRVAAVGEPTSPSIVPAPDAPVDLQLAGFVFAAARRHLLISPPEEHDAIRARVETITTRDQARQYLAEVRRHAQAAQAQHRRKPGGK